MSGSPLSVLRLSVKRSLIEEGDHVTV